ncbi:MAG: hypothetical protein JW828_11205 [Sedimentisphaerales bacterium]|nr:hypothetical protein [Sedimentisphaerales bacterium]
MIEFLITTSLLILFAGSFANLADKLMVTSKQNQAHRDSLIDLYVRLGEFSYIEAIHQAHSKCSTWFNIIYGEKHFSWRCFTISCLTSILSIFMLLVAFILLGHTPLWAVKNIVKYIIALCIFNLFIDYISLLETRIILGWARRVNGWNILWLWVIDIALSAALFLIPFLFVRQYVPSLFQRAGVVSTSGIWPSERMSIAMGGIPLGKVYITPWKQPQIQICFISTFATSVIFFLYSLGVVIFKALSRFRRPIMHCIQSISEQNRILATLGFILFSLIAIMGIIKKICLLFGQ